MFESEFKAVTVNSIKNELTKRNVSVISLMKFYDKSKIVIYKVIGSVIYTIVDNCICLDCLDFFQEKLSKHDNIFENTKFKDLY